MKSDEGILSIACRAEMSTAALALATALLSTGCGGTSGVEQERPAPEESVATQSQAMNGMLGVLDCNDTVDQALAKAAIQTAFNNVVQKVLQAPGSFISCLANSTLSSAGPGYAERIQEALATNIATQITCGDLANGASGTTGSLATDFERINVDIQGALRDSLNGELEDTIAHELAHSHSYGHSLVNGGCLPGDGCTLPPDQLTMVVWQVGRCANPKVTPPRGKVRSLIPFEQELGQVGGNGGGPTILKCTDNAIVDRLVLRSGQFIDNLAFQCRGLPELGGSTSTVTTTAAVGGGGGGPSSQGCNANEVAVGAYGRAGDNLDALGLLCRLKTDVTMRNVTTPRQVPLVGGGGGIAWSRACGAGMVLRGAIARSGLLVDRLQLLCREIDSAVNFTDTSLPAFGSLQNDQPREDIAICPARGVLTSLDGASGDELDRLGGGCQSIQCTDSSHCSLIGHVGTNGLPDDRDNDGIPDDVYQLQGEGGERGATFSDRCGPGQALVGMEVRSGFRVDQIRGICAPVSTWFGGTTCQTPGVCGFFPPRGGGGGNAGNRTCPSGSFLAGWRIGTVAIGEPFTVPQFDDVRQVAQLVLTCRRPTISLIAVPPNSWVGNKAYKLGDQVTFSGKVYQVRQAHTSQAGWEPPNVPALWFIPTPLGITPWDVQTMYRVGSEVTFNGSTFVALQEHMSLSGWDPPSAPALWSTVVTNPPPPPPNPK